MPGSRTTLPHTALTLLLTAPLSCAPADQEGQVSDPQGCRTVILPANAEASTSSGTSTDDSSLTSSTAGTESADATASATVGSTTSEPSSCGDGVVDPAEECDDGNDSNTDDCVDSCLLAFCGDGYVHEDDEECDDGNTDDNDECPSTCAPASCGDGFVQDAAEECDDGNTSNTDACTNACTLAACGDGYIQQDEACDDGNTDDADACSSDCMTERRFVFATFGYYSGNLGGLAGADALCTSLVDDARADMVPEVLAERTFKAWLSDDAQSPSTRFSASAEDFGGTYVLVDASKQPVTLIPVAVGWSGLVSGALEHPLDHDQHGDAIIADKAVWTNTQPNGADGKWAMANNQLDDAHCQKWSGTSGFGNTGATDLQTGNWTASSAAGCNNYARLYCIEDP